MDQPKEKDIEAVKEASLIWLKIYNSEKVVNQWAAQNWATQFLEQLIW